MNKIKEKLEYYNTQGTKIKSNIPSGIDSIMIFILIIAGVSAGILGWNNAALGIWLGAIGMCIGVLMCCAKLIIELLIIIVEKINHL